ncbi:MAG TPA: hypothetical protein VFZ34_12765 [Blastocatellia bacterium]|nr:hypothetical protein [Blastocatellia bacterium]
MPASKKAPSERRTNPVKVKLCYHKKKKTFKPPKPITLIVANKDEVVWTCKEARLEINFDPQDTPFLTSRFRCAIGGGALSGVPSRRRAVQKTYTYTVTALAINKPDSAAKKRCSKVRLVSPVKEGKPLPSVEGTLTIRFRKPPKTTEPKANA